MFELGETTGVMGSGGGGVSSSTWGRSGSRVAESLGEAAPPFVLDPEMGLPCAIGVESADKPRRIRSSTSRFFDSIAFFRVVKVSF